MVSLNLWASVCCILTFNTAPWARRQVRSADGPVWRRCAHFVCTRWNTLKLLFGSVYNHQKYIYCDLGFSMIASFVKFPVMFLLTFMHVYALMFMCFFKTHPQWLTVTSTLWNVIMSWIWNPLAPCDLFGRDLNMSAFQHFLLSKVPIIYSISIYMCYINFKNTNWNEDARTCFCYEL